MELAVPSDEDALSWYSLFNSPQVMEYIGDGKIQSLEWYQEFVLRQQELHRAEGYCLYSIQVMSQTIGFAGLFPWRHSWGPPLGTVELGYRLGQEFGGTVTLLKLPERFSSMRIL